MMQMISGMDWTFGGVLEVAALFLLFSHWPTLVCQAAKPLTKAAGARLCQAPLCCYGEFLHPGLVDCNYSNGRG